MLDVVVNEEDTVWALKIKIFEALNVFPAKQSVSYKDPDEVHYLHLCLIFICCFNYNINMNENIHSNTRSSLSSYNIFSLFLSLNLHLYSSIITIDNHEYYALATSVYRETTTNAHSCPANNISFAYHFIFSSHALLLLCTTK